MLQKIITPLFVILVIILTSAGSVFGQASDKEKLAKDAQNPISNMISLPFQNNTNVNLGPEEGTQISLFSNVWSFAGEGERDVNIFTWQYFVNYNLPKGWYLSSAPIITANWEEENGNRWTVPFGGGMGKIFRVGRQPLNAQVSSYYNAKKPEYGPDWQLRVQLQFLFPK